MTTPDQTVDAKFSNGVIDHSRMRIGPGKLNEDIFVRTNGANTEFPIASRMATNNRYLWKTLSDLCHIRRSGFRIKISAAGQTRRSADFQPRVNVNVYIQLRGETHDRIIVRMTARDRLCSRSRIFNTNAWTISNPLDDLRATFIRETGIDRRAAGKTLFIALQNSQNFCIIRIWIKRLFQRPANVL